MWLVDLFVLKICDEFFDTDFLLFFTGKNFE